VSGDIRPLEWKKGTTDTLENLALTDGIMAIADADYFDWPVLPEAPSSLNAALEGNTVRLSWQVHGGNPQHIVVERREDPANGRGAWQRIVELPMTATDFVDSQVKKGQPVSYRVRAVNGGGDSATSNTVRVPAA
jgi:hypothetical protein